MQDKNQNSKLIDSQISDQLTSDKQNNLSNEEWKTYNHHIRTPEEEKQFHITYRVELRDVKLLMVQSVFEKSISADDLTNYIKKVTTIIRGVVGVSNSLLELIIKFELSANQEPSIQISYKGDGVKNGILSYIQDSLTVLDSPDIKGDLIAFETHYIINFPKKYYPL